LSFELDPDVRWGERKVLLPVPVLVTVAQAKPF
jgi:hypothetical protein